MATITANISASDTVIPTSEELEIGHYTIDDENINVTGSSRGAEGRAFDRLFASVNRAVGGSIAASHTSGATLTRYYPDAAGGGGGTFDGGTITEPLVIEPTEAPAEAAFSVADENGFVLAQVGAPDLPNSFRGPGTPGDAAIILTIEDESLNELFFIDTSGFSKFRIPEAAPDGWHQIEYFGDTQNIRPLAMKDIDAPFIAGTNPFGWRFSVLKTGVPIINASAAPADEDLFNGEMALWFDSTDLTPKLMIKAKSADGTVVTGEVALT